MSLSHSASTSRVQSAQSIPNIPTNLSPSLVKRMQQDSCYNCDQLGHWSCYCPLKTFKTKLDSSNHEIPSSISPNLEERMRQSTCYSCGQRGHWSWYCPSKSSKTKHDSNTREIPAGISPNIEERMRQSKCYSCGQRGHWSWYCPSKSSNAKPISPSPKYDYSSVSSNLIRCDYPINESDLQLPPLKYPVCTCGAGVCRRVKGTGSDDAFKYFFACPFEQGHGSCGYLVPEDELPNSKTIVPIQQIRPKTLTDIGDGSQVQIKNIRTTNYSVTSSMAVFEIADKEDAGAPPKGWLGRLLFFYPTPSLKFLTPQPFFCCVFPSYNAIAVPLLLNVTNLLLLVLVNFLIMFWTISVLYHLL